jgi:hypothetical protein
VPRVPRPPSTAATPTARLHRRALPVANAGSRAAQCNAVQCAATRNADSNGRTNGRAAQLGLADPPGGKASQWCGHRPTAAAVLQQPLCSTPRRLQCYSATATAAKSTHSILFALYRRTLTLSEHTTLTDCAAESLPRSAAQRSLLGPSDANASSESTSGHTSAGCRCASCVKKFAGQRHDLDRMKSERSSDSCDMIDQCDYAVDSCARRHCSVARTAALVVCGSRKTSCACMLSMPGRRESRGRSEGVPYLLEGTT